MSENWRARALRLLTSAGVRTQPAVFSAQLRSRHPHVAFDATFQFWWQGDDQAAFWAVRQEITEWADTVTGRYCVTQVGNAENEINTGLASGVRVRLAVSPQARVAAEAFLKIERQIALERSRQRIELERIRYLRECIYSRPDVARSYWLYHHPDRPEELLTDKFEQIAEKFGDVAESRSLVIAKLIENFLERLEDGERRYLIGQLGQVFSSYNRPDLAERLEVS